MDTRVESVQVNGRGYARPRAPVVVVRVDGCEPDYITQAIEADVAPYLKPMVEQGTSPIGDCALRNFDVFDLALNHVAPPR